MRFAAPFKCFEDSAAQANLPILAPLPAPPFPRRHLMLHSQESTASYFRTALNKRVCPEIH